MAILTGPEVERIYRERATVTLDDGELIHVLPYLDVKPWPEHPAGPNSLDLRLAPELLVYDLQGGNRELDQKRDNPTVRVTIPPEGLILNPGTLYVGSTIERTECHGLVPVINGRSSVGRLGISVHVTAGFGDDGFAGTWVLELTVVHPVRVYAGVRICQIYFHPITGERRPYVGKYTDQSGPVASRAYMDAAQLDHGH